MAKIGSVIDNVASVVVAVVIVVLVFVVVVAYKISFGPEIFLKILYLNSSLSCVVYQKIDCTLTKLLSERELSFAVWLREVCTFDRQCLF